jgi:hypothetical protein
MKNKCPTIEMSERKSYLINWNTFIFKMYFWFPIIAENYAYSIDQMRNTVNGLEVEVAIIVWQYAR